VGDRVRSVRGISHS